MGIFNNDKSVSAIHFQDKSVSFVYYMDRLIWSVEDVIQSCFYNGYWIDDYIWTDDVCWTD